jgi:hypothetical protein
MYVSLFWFIGDWKFVAYPSAILAGSILVDETCDPCFLSTRKNAIEPRRLMEGGRPIHTG